MNWLNVKKLLLFFIKLVFTLIGFSILIVLIFRFVPVPLTPLMVIRSFESRPTEKEKLLYQWVSLDKISKNIQKAVVKSEDYKFYEHRGFDFEAIEKAMEYNKTHKRKKGASTISQQTAKNLFLWPSRSWVRKGAEAYFTVLMELLWPKERILEVYLNIIEFGSHVYGVEAASQKFYKKPALNLTAPEAALMAAVLPNPRKFKINAPSHYVLGRRESILDRILGHKVESKSDSIQILHDEEFELDSDDSNHKSNGQNTPNEAGVHQADQGQHVSSDEIKELEQNLEEEFDSMVDDQ